MKAREDLRIRLPTVLACPSHQRGALGAARSVPHAAFPHSGLAGGFFPSSLIALHSPLVITPSFGLGTAAEVHHSGNRGERTPRGSGGSASRGGPGGAQPERGRGERGQGGAHPERVRGSGEAHPEGVRVFGGSASRAGRRERSPGPGPGDGRWQCSIM